VVGKARGVFAFVLGIALACVFSGKIAEGISTEGTKVLFLESYIANNIAVWILICTSVVMLIGKFHNTKTEKLCGFISGVVMFIMYVQYVRTVEEMKHYMIISIAVLLACLIIAGVLLSKNNGNSSIYFGYLSIVFGCFPLLFIVYAFFTKLLKFSTGFWLVVTSIVMLLVGMVTMCIVGDD
jgi:hypothetical protein